MHSNLGSGAFKYQQPQQPHIEHNLAHVQNNNSSGALSNAHQHAFSAAGTPGNAYNTQQHATNGATAQPTSIHWQEQLQLCQASRQAGSPHHHARSPAHRSGAASLSGPKSRKEEEEEKRRAKGISHRQDWVALDFSGQGLRALSNALFKYTFLDKLFINHNKLTKLPSAIGRLKLLTLLDASSNNLVELPVELGMLTSLKQLLLFDNQITVIPPELGTLYQLETLGIEGNPIQDPLKQIMMKEGTKALVTYLRENCPVGLPPTARDWVVLNDGDKSSGKEDDHFTVLCYNILCDKYATQTMYGYTASWALNWDYRKELILQELQGHNADIVCLQEVATDNFEEVFSPALAYHEYKGVFWPKSRAKIMSESEKKNVDGCATFYKTTKYNLIEKQVIDFSSSAIAREDMKKTADIYNRVMPKDNIAVVTFLENKQTGYRVIIANVHITWDPAFKDVKLVQTAMLMEELVKISDRFAKNNPPAKYSAGETSPPTVTYSEGTQIPLIICGDFNSSADSGVYELLAKGSVHSEHDDLAGRTYGNFTKDGMSHPFSLKSSYANIGELSFTNYTPGFSGVIDYVWYSTNTLQVSGLLGEVDEEYMERVAGFPNVHFPSDHIALLAEFQVKPQKPKLVKPPPPDFGNSSSSRKQ
ncbi:Endonuclease/exonuclease/phosphatase [Kalaharituber pfeilii]|nr:Endonuclease/exonuclease/phosphatase [Kalaharituber pfeilii]